MNLLWCSSAFLRVRSIERQGAYDNDYYFGPPSYGSGVATGIATGLAIDTFAYTLPPNCVHADYGGLAYRRRGDIWYQLTTIPGIHYVVVKRPY